MKVIETRRDLTLSSCIVLIMVATTWVMASGVLASDNLPRGRQASEIDDGNYPASYFPNTEILGAHEMRITALGTGMPNQTRAAVSISYLVELG